MTNKRTFPLADILSVTTGTLMSRRKPPIEGVYEVINFMCEDNLMTHQLPRGAESCTPEIIRQLPWLKDVGEPPNVSSHPDRDKAVADMWAWLETAESMFGAQHELTAGVPGYQKVNPITEFQQMAPQATMLGLIVPD